MPSALDSAASGAAAGSPLGAFGSIAGGLIGLGVGLFQGHKAKKLRDKLQYPTEAMPQEVIENQNIARQVAATGMPSEQYSNAMKNIQRQQLAALRGANDRRAGAGLIGGIQQNTNDAALNLDAEDARMHINNQGQLMNANSNVAGWKSKLFDANDRQKYIQDYNYAMGLQGAANDNAIGGLDKTFAGIGYGLDNGWFSGKKGNGGGVSVGDPYGGSFGD